MPEGRNVFVEFHALTSHVPANLNRDELGTPKTALFGGERRLRISSQCLKRSWRKSEFFVGQFAENELGLRTARLPAKVLEALGDAGLADAAKEGLLALLATIGKSSKAKADDDVEEESPAEPAGERVPDGQHDAVLRTAHLLFLSRQEIEAVTEFARKHAAELERVLGEGQGRGARKPSKEKLDKLREDLKAHLGEKCRRNAVDVALFGRFITSDEIASVDAAAQVAHALGTQAVKLEYDYFSAVDDCQGPEEQGAGHIGESEFAASVFYKYAVCDWRQLLHNLAGEKDLAARSMKALALAVARAVPSGKKNSTAPQNPADYLEIVVRRDAPLSLANAFLRPVKPTPDGDVMDESINKPQAQRDRYQKAYSSPEAILGRFVLCLRDVPVGEAARPFDALPVLAEAVKSCLLAPGGL